MPPRRQAPKKTARAPPHAPTRAERRAAARAKARAETRAEAHEEARTTSRARARAPARAGKPAKRAAAARKKPGIVVPREWRLDPRGKSISRDVKTKNFLEAVDLICAIADVAEALDHHPDLHLERWNHLRITTYSHDVGQLTERDERLAGRINAVLKKRGATGPAA